MRHSPPISPVCAYSQALMICTWIHHTAPNIGTSGVVAAIHHQGGSAHAGTQTPLQFVPASCPPEGPPARHCAASIHSKPYSPIGNF